MCLAELWELSARTYHSSDSRIGPRTIHHCLAGSTLCSPTTTCLVVELVVGGKKDITSSFLSKYEHKKGKGKKGMGIGQVADNSNSSNQDVLLRKGS